MENNNLLKVKVKFLEKKYVRTIIIKSDETLCGLHEAILNSYSLVDCHLHAFFLDNNFWSKSNSVCTSHGANLENGVDSCTVKLSEMLYVGMEFCYVYDFGDELRFGIEVQPLEEEYNFTTSFAVVESSGGKIKHDSSL